MCGGGEGGTGGRGRKREEITKTWSRSSGEKVQRLGMPGHNSKNKDEADHHNIQTPHLQTMPTPKPSAK